MPLAAQATNRAGTQTTPAGGSYSTVTSSYANSHGSAQSYGMSVTGHLQPANIDWTTIRNTANAELARRSSNGTAAPAIANPISASEWNSIVAAFNVSDPHTDSAYNTSGTLTVTTWGPTGAPGAPSGYPVTGGQVQRITSAYAIALCNALNAAGAVCTCNCNYCTCNCNYCTCNCNYACTCNCNYSDIRLKENVEFVETQCGLNIYSWNYKWDKNSTYHGVLAHELVGTQYSCALTLDPAGYYMVDYNQLPVEMSKE